MTDLEIILSITGLIIAAISLLFAIFTAGIAFVAILEWRSYRDFQKKKRESLIQGNQVIAQLVKAKKDFERDTSDIINKISKKENKKIPQEELKKINDLEKKIDKIIRRTEDKLSNIETSIPTITSTIPFLGNTSGWVTGINSTTNIGFGDRRCTRCGALYYHPITSVTMDNGLCANCKLLNIKI